MKVLATKLFRDTEQTWESFSGNWNIFGDWPGVSWERERERDKNGGYHGKNDWLLK